MTRNQTLLLTLFILMPLLGAGCPCDPEATNNKGYCAFLENLAELAYGRRPPADTSPPSVRCPPRLFCNEPYCIRGANNGGFAWAHPVASYRAWYWGGDLSELAILKNDSGLPTTCNDDRALRFWATTPSGSPELGASRSKSEVYQVVHLDLLPSLSAQMRRVRVQAAFLINVDTPWPDLDDQFGIRIDAYQGNPHSFPIDTDHEALPASSPGEWALLTSSQTSFQYDFSEDEVVDWQPLQATLALPEETDFLVVLLEAYENNSNDSEQEFHRQYVDRVEIVLDGGPYGPVASPDHAVTNQNTDIPIRVLDNDYDPDARLNRSTLSVVVPSQHGTAEVAESGIITYTPALDFIGTDTFSYSITDADGLTAGALVTVEVLPSSNRPPIAYGDAFHTPPGTETVLDVVVNDVDPDDDAILIEAIGTPLNGRAVLTSDNRISYRPTAGFTGTDFFGYIAIDENGARSSTEAEIIVHVNNGPAYDLAVTASATPDEVFPGESTTLTITVSNNGPANATGVVVSFPLSPSIFITTDTQTTQGDYNGTSLWDVGLLATGGSATLTLTGNPLRDLAQLALITGGLSTGDDPLNNSALASVAISDANRFPVVTDPIDNITLSADPAGSCSFDLNDHFSDPDGDPLRYSRLLSSGAVTATINGSVLTVTAAALGQATVEINAGDPGGLVARNTFTADVLLGATDCGGNAIMR